MKRITYLTDMDVLGTPGLSAAKPRLTARAVVVNPQGQLAVMYAEKYDIHTLPGGGVEEGVSIVENDKTSSPLSDRISKDLKQRGMRFVGTTIVYSYLQAIGVIDSHEDGCWAAK